MRTFGSGETEVLFCGGPLDGLTDRRKEFPEYIDAPPTDEMKTGDRILYKLETGPPMKYVFVPKQPPQV